MRIVAIFLLIIDVIIMLCCIMEVCEAGLAESRQNGIIAWGMTVIVGIFLALIAKFC